MIYVPDKDSLEIRRSRGDPCVGDVEREIRCNPEVPQEIKDADFDNINVELQDLPAGDTGISVTLAGTDFKHIFVKSAENIGR
jgi:hypothetical protein